MDFYEYTQKFKYGFNLTDADLAEIMGIGQITYENYLSGYVTPSRTAVERLVKAAAFKEERNAERPLDSRETEKIRELLCSRARFGIEITESNLESQGVYKGCLGIIQSGVEPKSGDILYVLIDGEKSGLMRFESSEGFCRLYDDTGETVIKRADFEKRVRTAGKLMYIAEKF